MGGHSVLGLQSPGARCISGGTALSLVLWGSTLISFTLQCRGGCDHREGKSVLLNDRGPLWMQPRLEKLSCSRHSVTSKSHDWTIFCGGGHLLCAGLFDLHMRTPLGAKTQLTSPSMSPACQSKHAFLHCPSYDHTFSLPWSSGWHNVLLGWFFLPPFLVFSFLSQGGYWLMSEERNTKQSISESNRTRPALSSRNLMWAIYII